jgi:tRNA threonylcarbamoyl adenosine modification protein YeaZ
MKILALELSTAQGSLAWLDIASDGSTSKQVSPDVVQSVIWPNDRKDSGLFFEHLNEVIRRYGLPQRIVVGLGPGSYAGVRIAIAAATGLQPAATAELVGYPSVCAMAGSNENYVVIGDARRKSFFVVTICNREVAGEYELPDQAGLRARLGEFSPEAPIVSSDSLPQFQPRVEQRFPSAEVLGRLAVQTERKFLMPPLEPIYLREANVTIPKPIFGRARS